MLFQKWHIKFSKQKYAYSLRKYIFNIYFADMLLRLGYETERYFENLPCSLWGFRGMSPEEADNRAEKMLVPSRQFFWDYFQMWQGQVSRYDLRRVRLWWLWSSNMRMMDHLKSLTIFPFLDSFRFSNLSHRIWYKCRVKHVSYTTDVPSVIEPTMIFWCCDFFMVCNFSYWYSLIVLLGPIFFLRLF